MRLGISVELLISFHKKCPKAGESRTLGAKEMDGELYFEQSELESYRRYLNTPWPHEEKKRPTIPSAIKDDIKQESNSCCAICGDANNGEIAHIEAVADSLNNSPDNLIYLCPNHHTQYDLGFKPSSNIDVETVQAAKLLKRHSRVRVQRYEANVVKLLQSITSELRTLEEKLQASDSADLTSVYVTELRQLMNGLPTLIKEAESQAKKDQEFSAVDKAVARYAPSVSKFASRVSSQSKPAQLRSAAESIVTSVNEALIEIDEVECPHCGGSGLTGLAGDICKFCHGDFVVSHEQAAAYDPEEVDDVLCPRCGGRGLTGLNGTFCAYCKGSCFVTHQEAEEYDENEIDETLCPRCGGNGTTGLVGNYCGYCDGSCYVSRQKAEEYDESEIDETLCPRCGGNGTTGLVGNYCTYCGGSCYISRQKAEEYDESDIDETDCPHCAGTGITGLVSNYCAYCGGSCYISRRKAKDYRKADMDEVDCPRCAGSGTTGLRGRFCALCKGSCTVSREKANAYHEKYGRQ
jgi:RecJ-like exonuclease